MPYACYSNIPVKKLSTKTLLPILFIFSKMITQNLQLGIQIWLNQPRSTTDYNMIIVNYGLWCKFDKIKRKKLLKTSDLREVKKKNKNKQAKMIETLI